MIATPIKRPSTILLIAPTLLVLIGFYAFLFKATHRQLLARRSEVARLTDEQPQIQRQLQALQAELDELGQQLSVAHQQRERLSSQQATLIAQQAALTRQVQFSSAQAGTMNQVIALLAQHQLAIVANQSRAQLDRLIEQENQALTSELNLATQVKQANHRSTMSGNDDDEASWQPPLDSPLVSMVTSVKASGPPSPLQPRHQHTIRLQGRFADVRDALRAVWQEFPEITITSVELEQIDVRSSVRHWTISLSL